VGKGVDAWDQARTSVAGMRHRARTPHTDAWYRAQTLCTKAAAGVTIATKRKWDLKHTKTLQSGRVSGRGWVAIRLG
jgi:hypothetical protein